MEGHGRIWNEWMKKLQIFIKIKQTLIFNSMVLNLKFDSLKFLHTMNIKNHRWLQCMSQIASEDFQTRAFYDLIQVSEVSFPFIFLNKTKDNVEFYTVTKSEVQTSFPSESVKSYSVHSFCLLTSTNSKSFLLLNDNYVHVIS